MAKGRPQQAMIVWNRLGVPDREREVRNQQMTPSSHKARCSCSICLILKKLSNLLTLFTQKGRDLRGVTPNPRIKVPLRKRLVSHFDIFERSVRRRTALGVFVRGMQQLSGIDGVLYVRKVLQFEACA